MATRYPDGTLESGMEQRDDTRDDDTVTNEGEKQKDLCTDALPTAKSEIVSEVDPLSGTIRVKYARETSADENVVHLHPSEPESGQEPSCDPGDSNTLAITDANEKVPISHDTQLEESKIEHKDSSCDPGDSDTLVVTDANEKVPISHDTQLEESKIEHKDSSCDPDDSDTLVITDANEKVPISHDTQLEESKIEHKDSSCDPGDSDTLVVTDANEKVPISHDTQLEETKIEHKDSSCDPGDSDTLVVTDADEKVPISYDTQLEESKIEHKDSSCDPDDSDTLVITDANEKVPISYDTQLEETKIEHKDSSCDPGDSDTLVVTDANEKVPISYDTQLEETKIEHKDSSCDPDDSDTLVITDANEKVPISHDTQLEETKIEHKDSSCDPGDSDTLAITDASEENILQGALLSLDLSKENIEFILEKGDIFLEKPQLLARKLKIEEDKTKRVIEILKYHNCQKQAKDISEDQKKKIEDCMRENPEFPTPGDIAMLSDVPLQVVIIYLQNRPLDDKQKADIKEKVNNGNSVEEIAGLLCLPSKSVQKYVENTFVTFSCQQGMNCFEIIRRKSGQFSTFGLRKLIISNDLKLQDQLCCILSKQNAQECFELKRYLDMFEESKTFFQIDETLSMEDINEITLSCDIEHLSFKLKKVESVIRDFMEQYNTNEVVTQHFAQLQKEQIQNLLADYRVEKLTFHFYRMIISHSFKQMIDKAYTRDKPIEVFNDILPMAFYYLKCSLPFRDITQIFANTCRSALTTHELFHLIFQQSDPVLRAFCIEHYSFCNPVPFYYPNLHTTNLDQFSVEFAICSELWYSIQHYNGLISFGLGRASWNPIGKSYLLDMIFETDFVKGNPQNSAFHFNSIDIQMTRNLFGEKMDRPGTECIKWAFIDCHRHSNKYLIRLICQQLDIALIHVTHQDYKNHKQNLVQDILNLTDSMKHVYLVIRDYEEKNELKFDDIIINGEPIKYVFIPKLTKPDTNINAVNATLKKLGHEILHLNNPKAIKSEFIERMGSKFIDEISLQTIWFEKKHIQNIIDCIAKSVSSSQIDFSFLEYYPLYVDYMACHHRASFGIDQENIDKLNREIQKLGKSLNNTQMGQIVEHFSDIIECENSALTLWKLSQDLALFSNQVLLKDIIIDENKIIEQKNDRYTIEILWREALLSIKYAKAKEEREERFILNFTSSYSNHVEKGEPFELIDGDNLRYFNQDINSLLANMYRKRLQKLEVMNEGKHIKIKEAPIVVSIFGPQSSGKSTLLNYCFGCKFLTSAGRCTRGIYASLAQLSRPVNCSDQFLILDTEGLDAIERGHIKDTSSINFDRTMVLFCLAVSQVVIINVRGDIGSEMQNLLLVCAYSLNKLKVKRVTAPQIFFVLNQQADPDTDKHLHTINILMERLNKESGIMDMEGMKISDVMRISRDNLFVLPSAFNSEQINKPGLNLFNSNVTKLSPTITFADKCADLRMAIIDRLDHMPDGERNSFLTMSEWMEMSGTIWDTIIRYQDIVKFRNVEEIKCNARLKKLIYQLMNEFINPHKHEYVEKTQQISEEIRKVNFLLNPNTILSGISTKFDQFFESHKKQCLDEYDTQCQNDMSFKNICMKVLCEESRANLIRLIYTEKKIYEDKIKFQISAVQIEKKLSESQKNFQEAIIKYVDTYLELSLEEQKVVFEESWIDCFSHEDMDKVKIEQIESFENLYSLFKLESLAMENQPDVFEFFRTANFQMDTIIHEIQNQILGSFSSKQFIFPCQENNIPMKGMTPFPGTYNFEYFSYRTVYESNTEKSLFSNKKIFISKWVPKECRPLIKHCSGYFNYPDIHWKALDKNNQILLLVSVLRSPHGSEESSWQKFLLHVSDIQKFTENEPNVSPATVKEMVNRLHFLLNVLNYEISFIQAKLNNEAERKMSTLVFAYAFKSLWQTKKNKREEHAQKKEKEKQRLLVYFLQKIENRRMARGSWDREKMKKSDCQISRKFALDLLTALKRGVLTAEQPVIENIFVGKKDELSHQALLLSANATISVELSRNNDEITDENHSVVQFICNRNEELRKLFSQRWSMIEHQIFYNVNNEIEMKFYKELGPIKEILNTLLENLKESRNQAGSPEHKAFDSDSNFEIGNILACATDSEITMKESPFKAMMLYLRMYLDPNITPEEFDLFFNNEFDVDGVKMRISDTYKLCNKPANPKHVLDEEIFKKFDYTKMFTSENIFNISDYVTEFLSTLSNYQFKMIPDEFGELVETIKKVFERDIIGCPNQCPSCGKLCERELHTNDGKCQIKTGHQICSMGGKVWNNDESKTAVLYMCDDYEDNTNMVLQGRASTWVRFKMLWVDQWDWTLPEDEKYVDLQKNNREFMKNIWNKFGRGILNYYQSRGTPITFVPYTASHDLCNRLTLKYSICFVIDGTVSMASEIRKTRISVGQFINKYKEIAHNIEFRVVIYRDHCDRRVIETFPNDNKFTTQHTAVQDFLSSVQAVGGGDFPEAVLDGLATAATKSEWKSFGIKNVIIHIYDAPPHGDFPNYTSHHPKSNKTHCCCCNHGTKCLFDWDRDVWDNLKKFNIHYNGINTGQRIPEFETTMKAKLEGLCGEFQTVGQEMVNDAVLEIFIHT